MEIKIERGNKKINIVKIPKYLSEALKLFNQQLEVGEIKIKEDGEYGFTLNRNIDRNDILPTSYHIKKVNKNSTQMFVLSSTTDVSVLEGGIDNEYMLMPDHNKKYFEYKKGLLKVGQHSTEVLDSTETGVRVEKMGNLREMVYLARKRKQMLIDKKRERLDKKDVLDIIFNAFEKYDSWTVKDLADFTGQPIAFIQEIVNEICNVDKKEHKNSYTLKEEYK